MAKMYINICDLCKNVTEKSLVWELTISHEHDKVEILDAEICDNCHDSLVGRLTEEVIPRLPKVSNTLSETDEPPSPIVTTVPAGQPTKELLDHEVNIVESNWNNSRRIQVNKELNDKCNHSSGFTMNEHAQVVCKTCEAPAND